MKKENLLLKRLLMLSLFLMFQTGISKAQVFWDQACYFPGTDPGHISVKHASQLNLNSSFTIELWINPVNSTTPANQNIIQKRLSGSNGYAVLLSSGKVSIRTNNTTRLTGGIVIPNNTWTHIAARYNSTNNNFSVYINGVLDASSTVPGALPVTNTDSLLIGKGSNNPFAGMMDNIRIWNDVLSPSLLARIYRSIIATNSGKYSSLVLSLPFQPNNSEGTDFTLDDKTSYNHNVSNAGVTGYDMSSRPSVTTSLNEAAFFDETTSDRYISGESGLGVEPNEHITIEAWVYPTGEENGPDQMIVSNGASVNDLSPNYGLCFSESGNYIGAFINGTIIYSDYFQIIPETWTHLAFKYSANTGKYEFFVNGMSFGEGLNNLGNITYSVNDEIFIGNKMDGYIDELRISEVAKSEELIQEYLFQSIDEGNKLPGIISAVYSFDGFLSSTVLNAPSLSFVNDADFSHPSAISDVPVSPLIRSDNIFNVFYLQNTNSRIPTGNQTSGSTNAYLNIGLNKTITDINVFIALNHTEENSLKIVLYSPDNDSCVLFDQLELAGETDNLITIFDDQADSSIANSGRYVSTQCHLKPQSNLLSTFGGSNSQGFWRLRVYDKFIGDIGRIEAFGLRFNNDDHKIYTLYTGTLLQGFYNADEEEMVRDTLSCKLRSNTAPYSIITTSKSYCTEQGETTFEFAPVAEIIPSMNNCYVQMNHRNSIETWSSGYTQFENFSNTSEYNFMRSAGAAFGNNQFEFSDGRHFGFYGGDVDQNGAVNLTDLTMAYNSASTFQTGYLITDVTGDNTVNLTDLSLIYNNSSKFVHAIKP